MRRAESWANAFFGLIWILWACVVPRVMNFFSPDGRFESPVFQGLVLAAAAACAVTGLLHLSPRVSANPFFRQMTLSAASLLILSPLLLELIFRAGISLNLPGFRSPGLYAAYTVDDDYWKMESVWKKKFFAPGSSMIQPLLGWSQVPVTPENPLGLQADTLARLKDDGRNKILFYGDSYIKGFADPDHQLPRYLQQRIPDADVLDLGGGGYGTDQIYLIFRETHKKVSKPFVMVGVLLFDDLDRAGLTFRGFWKPYFVPGDGGKLELRGVPVQAPAEGIRPHVFSYAAAFIRTRLGIKRNNRALIKKLNLEFMDAIQESCRENCSGLAYVLFYNEDYLVRSDWRKDFMKAELEKRGIDIIDTKPMLYRYAAEHNMDSMKPFYDPVDYHHNNLGNGVIGEGILSYLKAKGYAAGQKSGVSL